MANSYTRQASGNIATGLTINAADLNAEFNELEGAFDATTGHDHSGGSGLGPKIILTGAAAVTGTLPIANGGTGASTAAAARAALDVQQLDATLTALAAYNTNGLLTQTAADTFAGRTLTAGSGKITVTNGNGVSGNPTVDLGSVSASDISGLGTMATQAASSVAITGGSITGITDLAVADGGTGASTASGARINLGLVIGTDVQAYDADTLKSDVTANLTVGYTATAYNAGTKSSGTFTPDPALGNLQRAVNGGAHTLAPPSADTTLVVQYTNNGSAGAITTSGFTKVDGSFTTTNGDDFMCYVTVVNSFSHLSIIALQ